MEEAAESRRGYFRLSFEELSGSMQIFEVGQNPISVEPRPVSIINLGGGGLYMRTDVDLPIRSGVYATFSFALQGQRFTFRGQLVRKTDDLTHSWYGVTFVDVDESVRGALIATLGRIQIERSRKGRAVHL
ncbi:MAG: PilZ domain-containing protein [Bacillota bacterium]